MAKLTIWTKYGGKIEKLYPNMEELFVDHLYYQEVLEVVAYQIDKNVEV